MCSSKTHSNQIVKDHGSSFCYGLAGAIEGEKDPRCLLVCLNLVQLTLQAFEGIEDNHFEDLFEVTACYFPISFNPPPNDPYGITKADLVNSLVSGSYPLYRLRNIFHSLTDITFVTFMIIYSIQLHAFCFYLERGIHGIFAISCSSLAAID
jgi:hypothetical protein